MKPFFRIAGKHDVGLEFKFDGSILRIIEFKPRATKNPFVVEDVKSGEKFLIPLTDYILEQIRKGEVTEIK
jgi:hypothetical protein